LYDSPKFSVLKIFFAKSASKIAFLSLPLIERAFFEWFTNKFFQRDHLYKTRISVGSYERTKTGSQYPLLSGKESEGSDCLWMFYIHPQPTIKTKEEHKL